MRIEDGVAVLVTHKAVPACCSIESDGTTTHVCGCMSKVALLSIVYPFVTRFPAFACRH